MRINVYSQELTGEVKLVEAKDREGGASHKGVRFFIASPDMLDYAADDDVRSAITFWIPNGLDFTAVDLARLLRSAGNLAQESYEEGLKK